MAEEYPEYPEPQSQPEFRPLAERVSPESLLSDDAVNEIASRTGYRVFTSHMFKTAVLSPQVAAGIAYTMLGANMLRVKSLTRRGMKPGGQREGMDPYEASAHAIEVYSYFITSVSSSVGKENFLDKLSQMITISRREEARGEEERKGILARIFGR
ncbi:hypothetical protein [Thermogladius sp.]|uniref:hypothetical protein n=1 Tax=Thermogladius sp. TaxID=2023064 RepID=UPI003D14432E